MAWGLKNQSEKQKVIISLTKTDLRLSILNGTDKDLEVTNAYQATYDSIPQISELISNWLNQTKIRNVDCHWLLARDLYKTINIKRPKVPENELNKSIKWLVKDQVDQPIENILVSYYQLASYEQKDQQLTTTIVDRTLVESLIETTNHNNLNIVGIWVDELSAGNALDAFLTEDKITGLIDQDEKGLIYNFYLGKELAFTRHIKGRFFPETREDGFTLENDSQQQLDRFLLETQRTLDYCISQIFRKPIDRLVISRGKEKQEELIHSLEQVTELSVNCFSSKSLIKGLHSPPHSFDLSISEAGTLFTPNKSKQTINFYLPEFHPKPMEFGFKFAASTVAIFVLGFIAFGMVQNIEHNQINDQIESQKQALNNLEKEVNLLNSGLRTKDKTLNLDKEIVKKQRLLASSQKLLMEVGQKSSVTTPKYSDVLVELSKQKTPSLWLTQINLHPNMMSLHGVTTKTESIPKYINTMSKNEKLSSKFENLIIERDKENSSFINFSMTNGRFNNEQ